MTKQEKIYNAVVEAKTSLMTLWSEPDPENPDGERIWRYWLDESELQKWIIGYLRSHPKVIDRVAFMEVLGVHTFGWDRVEEVLTPPMWWATRDLIAEFPHYQKIWNKGKPYSCSAVDDIWGVVTIKFGRKRSRRK